MHLCGACEKSDAGLQEPFKSCQRCSSQMYCSRECQKSDWEEHKRGCGISILDSMSGPSRRHYESLVPHDFLHEFSEKDVYDMLDDAFFLRIADRYCFTKDKMVMGGNLNNFRDFLDLAEYRDGLLPAWWSESKRRKCEKTAGETERMAPGLEDYDTKDFVLDHAIMCAYKVDDSPDYEMPMKLRLLAEMVYGTKIPLALYGGSSARNWTARQIA